MAQSPYASKEWKELRAQVLRDEPVCHWCGKAPSTEADHIIELHRGGDNNRDNLVGSCKPCNAARGARYGNRTRASKALKAREATGTPQVVVRRSTGTTRASMSFLEPTPLDPEPPITVSPPKSEDRNGSVTISPHLELVGRAEPRLVMPVLGATASRGMEVGNLAASMLGKELMPWQRRVMDDLLSVDDAGNFLWREALVSTARQNGKSVVLTALAAWWLTVEAQRRREPQFVLLLTNTLKRTDAMFRELAIRLEAGAGAVPRWGNGSQSITMPDGSVLKVAAAKDNLHGFSVDLCLVDEVWDVAPSVVFSAIRPSMVARRNPMLAMWSTAGDQSSTLMLRYRDQAIKAIDDGRPARLYFAEWSPPPNVNLDDRQWWPWANPALGTTIDWAALEEQRDSPDRAGFLRSTLNVWITSTDSWLAVGTWERGTTTDPMPSGGILAVDSSVDESRYVGLRAVSTPAGVQVAVEFVVDSMAAMWAEVGRVMEDPQVQLRITPGLDLQTPLPLQRRTQTRGYQELVTATPVVRAMIGEGRLHHDGSGILAEHVGRAALVKTQNGIVVSTKKSPGPIELCRCMIWATADAARPKTTGKPALGIARN